MISPVADPGASTTAGDSAPKVTCIHCGEPVFSDRYRSAEGEPFCCGGCQAAYSLIHGSGLADYYRLRREFDRSGGPSRGSGSSFEEFDDAKFHELHVHQREQGCCSIEVFLQGVHCAACVWLVERLPAIEPGVVDVRVSLARSTAEVLWDPERTQLSSIAQSLDRLGYSPHPVSEEARAQANRREEREQLGRLAAAGACAGNNMLVALALYAGEMAHMEPQHATFLRWVSALVGLVSLAWPGSVFFRGAWSAIRTRTPHLDVPLALGLGVGGIGGLVNTFRGTGDIYFDSLSILVFLLLVGRFIQYRQQRRAADSVALLRSMTPRSAHLVEEDRIRTVPIEALDRGDLVEVRVGEMVPADGEVICGSSAIDQSLLTGESDPVPVTEGAQVIAGSVNLSAPVRVRVEATGAESRAGRLARMVEEATGDRPRVLEFAHRVSGYFVVVVIGLALVTVAAWWPIAPAAGIQNAVALLVVSCPCALGLATPLALAVAQGRAARRLILIRGGEVLERLARPGRIWLDKTGTITEGKMAVRQWTGRTDLQPAVAALERDAHHPIARAVFSYIEKQSLPADVDVCAARQIHGAGVVGVIDGRQVRVGSLELMKSENVTLPEPLAAALAQVIEAGWTPVLVGEDTEVVAVIGVGDDVRPDARPSIESLRARGWRVGILSGDHQAVVERVARAVGIDPADALGGMSPEEKLRRVRDSNGDGTVVMVGDGINDGAALAAASVGVAVHGGAEVSLKAAPVYLGRAGLEPLVELVDGSRRTLHIIRRNFIASIAYNVVAAGLAMTGIISPLLAALLMPASSMTVVTLSLTGRTFGERR